MKSIEHTESENLKSSIDVLESLSQQAQKMDELHKKYEQRQNVTIDTKYLRNTNDFVKYCTITNAIDCLRLVTT